MHRWPQAPSGVEVNPEPSTLDGPTRMVWAVQPGELLLVHRARRVRLQTVEAMCGAGFDAVAILAHERAPEVLAMCRECQRSAGTAPVCPRATVGR